jgi:catechol 2,3-dioxygenase-like lactoylglutathione lyase family enzyme
MRLDHVSYAVSHAELADTVQRLGSLLGGTFVDGGRHPSFGTNNFVMPLMGGTYVEVVAALDHPAAEKAPFGRAVRARADAGGGWMGWVIAVDDLAVIEQRLGRQAVEGQRVRPDGVVLTWRQIGVNDLLADASLPFFAQWTCSSDLHPSAVAEPTVTAVACELSGDRERIREWIGGELSSPVADSAITWVDDEDQGLVAVHFRTPSGETVRID